MLPLDVFEWKYLVEYPSSEIWLSEAEAWLPSNGLKIYTDGSLFKGRVRSGVFQEALDFKASFAIGLFATNYCLRECMTGKTICICSNSQTTLLALSSHTVSSRLVFQCRNSHNIHNRIQLFWVPGHCGIIANEEADGLAGVGSKSNFYGPEPCLRVPKSLMTRMTK
jgi:hypothetical protein